MNYRFIYFLLFFYSLMVHAVETSKQLPAKSVIKNAPVKTSAVAAIKTANPVASTSSTTVSTVTKNQPNTAPKVTQQTTLTTATGAPASTATVLLASEKVTPSPITTTAVAVATAHKSLYLKSQCYKRFHVRDYNIALSCTENYARRGDEVAQYYLGLMYYRGYGVKLDHKKAFFWFNKSAERAYAPAENSLGLLYDNGQGVVQNFRTAFSWYLKAASQGHVIAQNNIAQMFYKGRGVLHDYKQAYVWSLIAASNGSRESMQLRDSLSVTLLPKQVEDAQDKAQKIAEAIENHSYGIPQEEPVEAVKTPQTAKTTQQVKTKP